MDSIKTHKPEILRISKQGKKLVVIIPKDSQFQYQEQVIVAPISFQDIKIEVTQ